MPLDDFINEIKKPNRKKNPITHEKEELKLKSVRIRPEDHKTLRYISLYQEISYVDLISEAIGMLEQKYKSK